MYLNLYTVAAGPSQASDNHLTKVHCFYFAFKDAPAEVRVRVKQQCSE